MRTASGSFLDRLSSGFTTLIRLWEINVDCKQVYRFNDGTRDLMYNGQIYRFNPGIEMSAIRKSTAEGYNDADVTFAVTDAGIDEPTVRYSELNGAKFRIIAVHWDDLSLGEMELFSGKLGNAKIQGDRVTVQALGSLYGNADLTIGKAFSERCRNVVYDKDCKANPAKYRVKFRVTGVDADGNFYMSIEVPTEDELDPEENVDILTNVTVTEFTDPGEGTFIVPPCTEFTVEVGGGSGGTDIVIDTGPTVTPLVDGGPSTFGGMTATGGKGGFQAPAYLDGANGMGSGGDTNSGKGPLGGHGKGPLELVVPEHKGGRGGLAAKTYRIGEDAEIGDVFEYSVGERGFGPTVIITAPDSLGLFGYVRIVAREIVETIDKADPQLDWDYGSVEWLSGANACRYSMIRDILKGKVSLMVNTNRPVEVGDVGYYRPGCTNYRSYCVGKFNNLRNFRAEPDVPNITAKVEVPVDTTKPPTKTDTNVGPARAPAIG